MITLRNNNLSYLSKIYLSQKHIIMPILSRNSEVLQNCTLVCCRFFYIYHHTVKTKEHTYTQNSKRLLSHKCPYIIYFYYDYNTLYRVLGWSEFSKQLLININKYLSVVEKRNIHIVNDERWWWVPILSKCFHTFWYKAMVLEATLALSPCKYLQVHLIYLTPLT